MEEDGCHGALSESFVQEDYSRFGLDIWQLRLVELLGVFTLLSNALLLACIFVRKTQNWTFNFCAGSLCVSQLMLAVMSLTVAAVRLTGSVLFAGGCSSVMPLVEFSLFIQSWSFTLMLHERFQITQRTNPVSLSLAKWLAGATWAISTVGIIGPGFVLDKYDSHSLTGLCNYADLHIVRHFFKPAVITVLPALISMGIMCGVACFVNHLSIGPAEKRTKMVVIVLRVQYVLMQIYAVAEGMSIYALYHNPLFNVLLSPWYVWFLCIPIFLVLNMFLQPLGLLVLPDLRASLRKVFCLEIIDEEQTQI